MLSYVFCGDIRLMLFSTCNQQSSNVRVAKRNARVLWRPCLHLNVLSLGRVDSLYICLCLAHTTGLLSGYTTCLVGWAGPSIYLQYFSTQVICPAWTRTHGSSCTGYVPIENALYFVLKYRRTVYQEIRLMAGHVQIGLLQEIDKFWPVWKSSFLIRFSDIFLFIRFPHSCCWFSHKTFPSSRRFQGHLPEK